jgi:hypothetical protein
MGPALLPPMTSQRSFDSMPARPRQVRFLAAILGVMTVLVGLVAAPCEAQSQLRSGVASVALSAYAAPGVHVAGSVMAERSPAGGAISDLAGMSVNTAYRIELRGSDTGPVVLLRQSRPGLVPWDQVRALLKTSDAGPVVLDLVLAPTL